MRSRHRVIWGTLGLAAAILGCEAPEEILPTTPPGAVVPRTPPDADNPAQAQGETIALTPKPAGETSTKPIPYTPATPTAKGETKTTKNGVKYETLKEGTGEELRPGKVAMFHYVGKLEDGTVFDSSRTKGQPAKFAIGTGQLIKGWEEAMPGMRVGEIRKLFIPPAMGYRDQQAGKIPPNSNLIFEVELVRIID